MLHIAGSLRWWRRILIPEVDKVFGLAWQKREDEPDKIAWAGHQDVARQDLVVLAGDANIGAAIGHVTGGIELGSGEFMPVGMVGIPIHIERATELPMRIEPRAGRRGAEQANA